MSVDLPELALILVEVIVKALQLNDSSRCCELLHFDTSSKDGREDNSHSERAYPRQQRHRSLFSAYHTISLRIII